MGGAVSDPEPVNIITLRDLERDTFGIVSRAHQERKTYYVTHHGGFVAKLVPLDDKQVIIDGLTAMIEQDPEAFGVDRETLTIDEVERRIGFQANDRDKSL